MSLQDVTTRVHNEKVARVKIIVKCKYSLFCTSTVVSLRRALQGDDTRALTVGRSATTVKVLTLGYFALTCD